MLTGSKIKYDHSIPTSDEYSELLSYYSDKVNGSLTSFITLQKQALSAWLVNKLEGAKTFTNPEVACILLAANAVNTLTERQKSWLGHLPFPHAKIEVPEEIEKSINSRLDYRLKTLKENELVDLPKEIQVIQGSFFMDTALSTLIAKLYAKMSRVQLAEKMGKKEEQIIEITEKKEEAPAEKVEVRVAP